VIHAREKKIQKSRQSSSRKSPAFLMTTTTRRVPNVFDGDFVLHKLWPTHTFPAMQKRGVKHKRLERNDKQNKRREGQDSEPEHQAQDQAISLHQQKQQVHQECHQQYINSARTFALTKGLVVAVVKGVQRVINEGLVPESKLDPNESEVHLIQRFFRSLSYEFSPQEVQQAVEDTAKLHDLLLTLDGQSRFCRENKI